MTTQSKVRGLYCTVCHRSFGRGGAFNTHKIGHFGLPIFKITKHKNGTVTRKHIGYGKPTRRCMTDAEMHAVGLGLKDGLWIVVEKNPQNQWDSRMEQEDQEIEEDEVIYASSK